MSMRVFLTGANGVVGRRHVPLLQNAGHEVTAAVRSSVAGAELTTKGVRAPLRSWLRRTLGWRESCQ